MSQKNYDLEHNPNIDAALSGATCMSLKDSIAMNKRVNDNADESQEALSDATYACWPTIVPWCHPTSLIPKLSCVV